MIRAADVRTMLDAKPRSHRQLIRWISALDRAARAAGKEFEFAGWWADYRAGPPA